MRLFRFEALPGFVFPHAPASTPSDNNSPASFIDFYQGCYFSGGAYRVFESRDVDKWRELVGLYFGKDRNKIYPLGIDWLGRIYAVDDEDSIVRIYCHITDDILDTESTMVEFYDSLLEKKFVEILDVELFKSLLSREGLSELPVGRVFSLVHPLNLGGVFSRDNFVLGYPEVDWEFASQIKRQI